MHRRRGEQATPETGVTEWTGRGEVMALGILAGIIFLGSGFYLLTNHVPPTFGSVDDPTAGAVSVASGLAMIFLAAFYRTFGQYRSYFGLAFIVIGGGELWFGGGFLAGSFLAAVAGVLAIVLPATERHHDPAATSSMP